MDQTEKPNYSPQNRNAKGQWGKWKGKTCIAEGCELPAVCRAMCSKHYQRKKWADGHRPPSVNPKDIRARHLKHRYGLTMDEHDAMLEAQGGVCAVCGESPTDKNTRAHWNGKLCVDHCHDSERVRGLLCNDCNLAVGYAKTAETAERIAAYLRLHDGPDHID